MKKQFRVLLPVEIGEQIYGFGQVVELDVATAKAYAHALVSVDEVEAAENHSKQQEAAGQAKAGPTPHVTMAQRMPEGK